MKDTLNGLAFIIFLVLILTIFIFYGVKRDKDFLASRRLAENDLQNKLSQKNFE